MGDDACLQSDNQNSVSGPTWWKERLDSSKLSSDLHTHPQLNVIKNLNSKAVISGISHGLRFTRGEGFLVTHPGKNDQILI